MVNGIKWFSRCKFGQKFTEGSYWMHTPQPGGHGRAEAGTASTKKLMREVLLINKTWRLSHNLECCLGRQMTVLKYFHKKNICIKQIMKMWGWHARDMRVKQKHVWVPHTHSDKSVFYIYKVDCYFFMFHVCIGTLITSSQASILRVRSFEKANKQFS